MSTDDQLEAISVRDPAIDLAGMPRGLMLEYSETRSRALLEPYMRPDAQPVVFTIRELKVLEFKWVMKQPTEIDRQFAAFQAALVRVDGMRSKDGAIISKESFARYDNGILRDDELEAFHPWVLIEIGDAAFMHSFFRGETERVYRLPPMLQSLWADHLALRAAQSQASQAQSSAAA